jgi:poly-gamma-glutamate synthesis protein (capsule biosynthesis protein)
MTKANRGDITIAYAGDFMVSRRPEKEAIDKTRELFTGADIVIANVDTVLSDLGTPVPKWANLRGPREAVGDLRAMGIDAVTLANNHAMDFRAEGMLDMCRAFDEAGILHAGAGENLAAALAPAVIQANDLSVAVLSAASTLPAEAAAESDVPGVAPLRVVCAYEVDESGQMEQPGAAPRVRTSINDEDLARMQQAVAAARASADVVLVFLHWGVAGPWRAAIHPTLQDYQRPLGHALIDAGADAVIGNHAHELHGIELYQGRPIAYSPGNFWIDTIAEFPFMGREACIVRLTVRRGQPPEAEIVPLMLDEDGVPHRDPGNRAVTILNAESFDLGANVVDDGGRFVVREI